MALIDVMRNNTKWSINQNPTEITITRETKTRAGGGYAVQTQTVGPFSVRIYRTSSGALAQQTSNAGTFESDEWSMLAPYDSDIGSGVLIDSEFETDLGTFKIKNVIPRKYNDLVFAYHVKLERVN